MKSVTRIVSLLLCVIVLTGVFTASAYSVNCESAAPVDMEIAETSTPDIMDYNHFYTNGGYYPILYTKHIIDLLKEYPGFAPEIIIRYITTLAGYFLDQI